MKKKLVILVALVIFVIWFYQKENVEPMPILHDTFTQVVESDDTPKNILRNEYVEHFLVNYMFPEASTILKENVRGLTYLEVIFGEEPSFLIAGINSEGDGAATLYDTKQKKSISIPKGPWAQSSECSLLQLDSGCGTRSEYIITPGGYIYWVMNDSFVYDEALYGVYFYDKNSWHRLTPKVKTFTIDTAGCNLYYSIGDTQRQRNFKLDVCGTLKLEVPTISTKKTYVEDDISYGVGFTQSITQEYTKNFKPSLKNRTFNIKVYPGCLKSSFVIRFGDGLSTYAECDSKVTHTYNDYGVYYAEVIHNGVVLEREKVVIPEPVIKKVDFELHDIERLKDNNLSARLTYSASPCNEEIATVNFLSLLINKAENPSSAKCQDSQKIFFKNDIKNITFEYLLNWDIVASSSFKNPFYGK